MYAGRKRRKPVQRAVKPPQSEGAKSNPSKRHRDRLNGELERLASLLPFPEEVTTSLDKLSILRLSVSYLRAKNFFTVALKNCTCSGGSADNSKATGLEDSWLPEGELLLQALNGFVLVVTNDGTIFYSSHTIQDYLGFHQTDIMHQSVYELVHTEDQQELRRNLHWALSPPTIMDTLGKSSSDVEPESGTTVTYNPEQLPPENSSFLERNFVCRFRCLLDNSSGFLALSLQGRLKFLRGQNQRQENRVKAPPQLALFAIATPLQPPSILEIRTKNMTFRTKHKLDFTPMACDAKGKIVLGYTEAELRVRGSGYQFIHAADMLYCAENHVRMMKTGESGLTVFRLLTKDNLWKWVQANARLVYKNGKPDYIIATQRPLMEEEGGEHLRKRSMHLPFTFATGEALLYQSSHPIGRFNHSTQGSEKNGNKSKKGRIDRVSRDGLDPGSLLGALMSQAESVYVCQPALEPQLSFHSSLFGDRVGFSDSDPTALLQGWDESSNRVVGTGLPEPASSFDPLLVTLDSLSLGGPGGGVDRNGDGGNGENCSNGELFGALEGLGLSAEDLELLLLDERMIRVEMDPERVPTLDDLLTNDEILSYIHDSLEANTDGAEDGDQVPSTIPGTNAPETTTKTTKAPVESNPTSATNVYPQYVPHNAPIVQQMQKHLNMQPGRAVQDWVQHSNHLPHPVVNGLQGQSQPIHNGEWTSLHILANTGVPVDDCHTPQTLLNGKASEPDGDHHWRQAHQRQHYLQQQQALVQIPLPHSHAKHPGANLNGVCGIPNTHTEHLPAGKQQWQDYSYCPPGETTPNSNPPGQTTLNSNPPGQTTLNSNPSGKTTLNSNPPGKTTLNSNPPGQTTLNSNPPGQTTLNSNPSGQTTLNSNPSGKTTLNSNPPGQTTLNSNPSRETTLVSNPSGQTTLNSNPPGQTTLNSNPPGETTLNSNPPGETTLNSNPSGKTTLNSNPSGKTTLNSNPSGQTTLNSNPPGETTLNSNPSGQTTLNSNPSGETILNSNPCLNDGQVPLLTHTTVAACMNYTMADIPGMDCTINRCTYGGNGQHHGTGAAVSSYQRMNHKQQQQEKLPPPLAQVQCPPPSATVEQILVVGHSSLEANGIVTSDIPHHPNHSKMENGCILNGTYSGGCVLPNRSGAL
ncbi:aryl hydrocarbon receptor-like [Oncorhynchus mykiss]|uniref:Aryl hydrocarbon receptor n=1 Tax=Oncorhynchus mykiss TaxID=8022 RepID=A0A8L0DPI0_ONCMY|nr:aryl hydrocarbon receptor-like [Oncorhynchus mykiss]XP_036815244.1 aryl hydrocarbon receptor-like [Oncorhynchus mykiss]